MPLHVIVGLKSDPHRDRVELDLSSEELARAIVAPFKARRRFAIDGEVINPDDVAYVRIRKTQESAASLLPLVRAQRRASRVEYSDRDEWFVASKGEDVTDAWLPAS